MCKEKECQCMYVLQKRRLMCGNSMQCDLGCCGTGQMSHAVTVHENFSLRGMRNCKRTSQSGTV